MDLLTGRALFWFALLLFISVIASKASNRTGIPVLLLFLVIGIIAGFDGITINFTSPQLAQFIGNIALVVILFSGGLDTSFKSIRKIIFPGIILSTIGVVITTLITALFIWFVFKSHYVFTQDQFSFWKALLLASIISSTDSASVFGILRGKSIHIRPKIKSLLELESGSNDPMAYILVVLFINIIQQPIKPSFTEIIFNLCTQIFIGFLIGYVLGRFVVWLMNQIRLNNHSLYAVLLLSCGFLVFSITNLLKGNGFLAVYIAGMVIGNHKFVHRKSILNFTDGMAWLFQIVMFLTLGIFVNIRQLIPVAWEGLLIGLFLIFIARPLMVFICLAYTKKISWKSKAFISWVGLRGAVPIVFATYPLTANMPIASFFFNIVFFITLLSLLIQGTSIPWVSQKLKQITVRTKEEANFRFELPEDMKGAIAEINITNNMLQAGSRIMALPLPDNTLVVMVKRNDKYMIPNGHTILKSGDKLLLIADNEFSLKHSLRNLGIEE